MTSIVAKYIIIICSGVTLVGGIAVIINCIQIICNLRGMHRPD